MFGLLTPTLVNSTLLLLGLTLACAGLLGWAARRWPVRSTALIDALDAALPQTQCAQCGYPGCRPYAQAIAAGEAGFDLCPPGGPDTQIALSQIMGTDSNTPTLLPNAPKLLAYINEAACIGCTLCLPACPVDAILGASAYQHTVITDECTGCELCIAPCPVDCIVMHSV